MVLGAMFCEEYTRRLLFWVLAEWMTLFADHADVAVFTFIPIVARGVVIQAAWFWAVTWAFAILRVSLGFLNEIYLGQMLTIAPPWILECCLHFAILAIV